MLTARGLPVHRVPARGNQQDVQRDLRRRTEHHGERDRPMLQVHRQSHRRTEHADDGADDNPGEADEPILRQPRAGQPGVSETSHRGDRHVSIAANHGRAHEREAARVGGGGGHLPLRADMARGSRGRDRRQAHLGESRLVRSPRQSFTPSFTPGYLPLPGASGYRTTDLSVYENPFQIRRKSPGWRRRPS